MSIVITVDFFSPRNNVVGIFGNVKGDWSTRVFKGMSSFYNILVIFLVVYFLPLVIFFDLNKDKYFPLDLV